MAVEVDNARMVAPEVTVHDATPICISEDTHSAQAADKSLPYRAVKRFFDFVLSLCVIVIGFIPGLILSVAVMVSTKGSPIYAEVRAGKNGKPFKIYKFRTMVVDSDDVAKYFTPEQLDLWKRERKVENDPRITKLGSGLRACSVDEFPQFVNVFLGQMSTIGPRAITFDELDWFGEDRSLLLSMRPGITGLWQTGLRNQATFESGVRQQLELEYVRTAGLKTDLAIFFKTFKTLFAGNGK